MVLGRWKCFRRFAERTPPCSRQHAVCLWPPFCPRFSAGGRSRTTRYRSRTRCRRAAESVRAKKFDEARKVYDGIAAEHPQSDIAAQARLGVANAYREQGDLPAAIPVLEQVLAADEHAALASVQKAKALLVEARSRIAASLAKAKKLDEAIAELRQTVTDKRSTPAGVRAALVEIAIRQAGVKPKDAIATYRELLKMPPVGDRERVADLRCSDPARSFGGRRARQIRQGAPRVSARVPGLGAGLRRRGLPAPQEARRRSRRRSPRRWPMPTCRSRRSAWR